MAKRDMRQTAATAKGKIPTGYEMTVAEWQELTREAETGREGAYNAVSTAFDYGFILGIRAAKAAAKRTSRANA